MSEPNDKHSDAMEHKLVTDGGEVVEHEGLDAVAAEEYGGDEECEYGCGSDAEYRVEIRLGGAADTLLTCNNCSQRHKVWVEKNELLRSDISEEAR